jgi:hypothetical protein
LERQDKLGVSEGLLKRLPFRLNTMMFGGYLLEAGGCLSQGAEDAKKITVGHSS